MLKAKREFKKKMPSMARRISMRQAQLRATNSRAELLVKSALDKLGVRYIFQKGFMCKGEAVRLVDFMLPGNSILLEIDGPEHDPIKDAYRERQIKRSAPGYSFLRIKNVDVYANEQNLTEYIYDLCHAHYNSLPKWQQNQTYKGNSDLVVFYEPRKLKIGSGERKHQEREILASCQDHQDENTGNSATQE